MVRTTYSFILSYHTLVNVPVVVTSFSLFCRMKENFMELYLVREQFQSDTCLVRYSKVSGTHIPFDLQNEDNFMEL